MGYEVAIIFHPRKEDGTYDYENKEEKTIKIGKPFDEVPLENLAAGIMSQMARRDIWVVDVKVCEIVRKDIGFKECKDGKGIILKNRKFSFNESAQMVAEDVCEAKPEDCSIPEELPSGMYPHEMIVHKRQQSTMDDLYGNPNKPVPVVKQNNQVKPLINPNKVLYHVYFEPYIYEKEVKRLGLKFTEEKKYPVHQIIPSPSGKLDAQKLAITDDTGRIVEVDEKYFSSAGLGLMADAELGFSGSNSRDIRKPKLAYEGEIYADTLDGAIPQGVARNNGMAPELMPNFDIRAKNR